MTTLKLHIYNLIEIGYRYYIQIMLEFKNNSNI